MVVEHHWDLVLGFCRLKCKQLYCFLVGYSEQATKQTSISSDECLLLVFFVVLSYPVEYPKAETNLDWRDIVVIGTRQAVNEQAIGLRWIAKNKLKIIQSVSHHGAIPV